MRFDPNDMHDDALLALYEFCMATEGEPVRRSFTLRFLLAYLYAHSDGQRGPFETFWRAASRHRWAGETESMAAYARGTYMRSGMETICKAVGADPMAIAERFTEYEMREARKSPDWPRPPHGALTWR
jgi:hypothetical protein